MFIKAAVHRYLHHQLSSPRSDDDEGRRWPPTQRHTTSTALHTHQAGVRCGGVAQSKTLKRRASQCTTPGGGGVVGGDRVQPDPDDTLVLPEARFTFCFNFPREMKAIFQALISISLILSYRSATNINQF